MTLLLGLILFVVGSLFSAWPLMLIFGAMIPGGCGFGHALLLSLVLWIVAGGSKLIIDVN
jgi:hypothetical protein